MALQESPPAQYAAICELVSKMANALILLGRDDSIVYANQAASIMLQGAGAGTHFDPEERLQRAEGLELYKLGKNNPIHRARAGDHCSGMEAVLVTPFHPQGSHVLVDAFPLTGHAADAPPGLVGIVFTDVDEVHRAEREREQLFRRTAAPIAMLSMDGRLLRVNPACEHLLGRDAETLWKLGTMVEITVAEDVPTMKEAIRRLPEEGEREFEAGVCKPDGSIVHVRWVATVDEWTDLIYFVGLDLTQAKALEAKGQELAQQLNEARKLESVGQLAAGIAHEINTPTQFTRDNVDFLSGIGTDLQDLVVELRDIAEGARGEQGEFSRRIDKALETFDADFVLEEMQGASSQALDGLTRIAAIVQAMKEFAHPGQTEATAFDINRVIETTLTVASNEWKYVADVEKQLTSDLPPIFGAPGELGQVLLNLVVNACHAIADHVQPGTKGKITLRSRHEGPHLIVEIQDTGGGIPEHIRHRIFDPFFTTKEVGRGTGQGLALAHRFIQNHDGTIEIESEVGVGTTFILRLPVEQCDAQTPLPVAA